MEEVMLIVNPKAGVDKNKEVILETAARLCESRGLRLNIEFTDGPGDASRIGKEAVSEGYATVVAAGGDGTVRDVADALWGSDTVMGILPFGSGNGLARSLGISQDAVTALATALGSHSITIDRGIADGKSFYSAFGVGMDAEVSFRFSQDKRRGRTTYIKHAVRQMFTYRPRRFRLKSDEMIIETEALLIAVCNCMQYGNNAYISPKADPTDGDLDITVVHQGNFLTKTMAGIDLFSGRLDHNILVEMFRSAELEIDCGGGESTCVAHLDGEPVEMPGKIKVACERRGLRVAVPEGRHTFVPVLTPMKAIWEDILGDIRKGLR